MSEETKIAWCDSTFNPWIGCTKVCPQCANCYAEELMDKRYGRAKWGDGNPRQRTSVQNWKQPIGWNRRFEEVWVKCPVCKCISSQAVGDDCIRSCGGIMQARIPRPRVFCGSLCDWLDDQARIEDLADLLRVMACTPNLDWLTLTKRPQNFKPRMLAAAAHIESTMTEFRRNNDPAWKMIYRWLYPGIPPQNIWLGVSVGVDPEPLLRMPAKVRFLSAEPLIEAVKIDPRFDWVIVGGESGAKARLCNQDWIRSAIKQCRKQAQAIFVKQLGTHTYKEGLSEMKHDDPKGGNPDEWPKDLHIRQYPQ